MNNYQKTTSKALALFLSVGMMSSLAGCELGSEGGEGDAIEQPTPAQDEGGEGGEGGDDD